MDVASCNKHLQLSFIRLQDLIHGAPIGKPVAKRASVTAVYGEDDGEEIHFTRM